MENTERIAPEDSTVNDTSVDYIEALNNLKENSVSKEDYLKLRDENKRLINSLVQGEKLDIPSKEKLDIKDLRAKLFDRDGDMSNLEYVDTALKLRSALIENGESDPFLPSGSHVSLTAEMYDKAQACADLLQECVDYADGDSGLFTARYQSLVQDATGFRGRLR